MIQDFTADILSVSQPLYKIKTIPWTDSRGFATKKHEVEAMFSGSLQPITSEEMSRYDPGFLRAGSAKLYVPISQIILDVDDQVKDSINRLWVVKTFDDWSMESNYIKYVLERVPDGLR